MYFVSLHFVVDFNTLNQVSYHMTVTVVGSSVLALGAFKPVLSVRDQTLTYVQALIPVNTDHLIPMSDFMCCYFPYVGICMSWDNLLK